MRSIIGASVDDRADRRRQLNRRDGDRLTEPDTREIDFLDRRGRKQHPLRFAVEIHARHTAEIEHVHILIHRFRTQREREIDENRVAGIIERARKIERGMFAVFVITPTFYPLPADITVARRIEYVRRRIGLRVTLQIFFYICRSCNDLECTARFVTVGKQGIAAERIQGGKIIARHGVEIKRRLDGAS